MKISYSSMVIVYSSMTLLAAASSGEETVEKPKTIVYSCVKDDNNQWIQQEKVLPVKPKETTNHLSNLENIARALQQEKVLPVKPKETTNHLSNLENIIRGWGTHYVHKKSGHLHFAYMPIDFSEEDEKSVDNRFIDLYGNQNSKYKINVVYVNTTYDDINAQRTEKPPLIKGFWIDNRSGDTPINFKSTKEENQTYEYTWAVTKGLCVDFPLIATVGFPSIAGISAGVIPSLSFSSTNTETKRVDFKWGDEFSLEAAPGTTRHIRLSLEPVHYNISFTSEFIISGDVNLKYYTGSLFSSNVHKHKIHKGIHTVVKQFFNKNPDHPDKENFRVNSNKTVTFLAKGMFSGIAVTNPSVENLHTLTKDQYPPDIKLEVLKSLFGN